MSYACLWSPEWSTGAGPDPEVVASLLEVVPRVAVERRGVVWADVRGGATGWGARALADRTAAPVRIGIAAVPVAAECAARGATPANPPSSVVTHSSPAAVEWATRSATEAGRDRVLVVEPGREREFLAPLPLALLGGGERLLALLEGVGLSRCGELASLDRESVEIRFGPEGVRLWRLARGDDDRRLFAPTPPEAPHASLDFIDYVVTDPEHLVFTANALLGSLVEALHSRGEHARCMELSLALAGGGVWRQTLRPARPTASRESWLRLIRRSLEGAVIPDAVSGVGLRVEATEAAAVRQGDLFDRGFASAAAVEAALARLIESQGPIFVRPEQTGHALPERRTIWIPADPFRAVSAPPPSPLSAALAPGPGGGPVPGAGEAKRAAGADGAGPVAGAGRPRSAAGDEERTTAGEDGSVRVGAARLTLHLLQEPRSIRVEVTERQGRAVPGRFRDGERWHRVVTAAGPDRISGGRWEKPCAREYFRCITATGELVWIFRDGIRDGWFLHGWWD